MSKFTNPLYNIKIASPCSADWNEMMGDERKRYCGDCKLNVYNLSEMTKAQAEDLIIKSEGNLCVRFYRRADGTILTQDCPVGWQAVKRRISKTAAAFASLIFGLLSGFGLNTFFSESKRNAPTTGQIAVQNVENNHVVLTPVNDEPEVMGKFAPDMPIAGGITNIESVRQEVKQKRRR